ncbi:helix-turn-helix domain-containing protein [Aquitalea sp.]|uniref:helix-turn-helix domain-containing protein n=1 Tax=Aquitalea sp. TaxID=1872623 RepID=UPI0025904DF2|nr:helix-turn-helix domain-containing protein [Aquitalea sp.]
MTDRLVVLSNYPEMATNAGSIHLTLTEVAEIMGFSDLSTFSQAYKRWTRLTPSSARKGMAALRNKAMQQATLAERLQDLRDPSLEIAMQDFRFKPAMCLCADKPGDSCTQIPAIEPMPPGTSAIGMKLVFVRQESGHSTFL